MLVFLFQLSLLLKLSQTLLSFFLWLPLFYFILFPCSLLLLFPHCRCRTASTIPPGKDSSELLTEYQSWRIQANCLFLCWQSRRRGTIWLHLPWASRSFPALNHTHTEPYTCACYDWQAHSTEHTQLTCRQHALTATHAAGERTNKSRIKVAPSSTETRTRTHNLKLDCRGLWCHRFFHLAPIFTNHRFKMWGEAVCVCTHWEELTCFHKRVLWWVTCTLITWQRAVAEWFDKWLELSYMSL